MAHRKNTAEAYEILLRIARKQEAERQREEERRRGESQEIAESPPPGSALRVAPAKGWARRGSSRTPFARDPAPAGPLRSPRRPGSPSGFDAGPAGRGTPSRAAEGSDASPASAGDRRAVLGLDPQPRTFGSRWLQRQERQLAGRSGSSGAEAQAAGARIRTRPRPADAQAPRRPIAPVAHESSGEPPPQRPCASRASPPPRSATAARAPDRAEAPALVAEACSGEEDLALGCLPAEHAFPRSREPRLEIFAESLGSALPLPPPDDDFGGGDGDEDAPDGGEFHEGGHQGGSGGGGGGWGGGSDGPDDDAPRAPDPDDGEADRSRRREKAPAGSAADPFRPAAATAILALLAGAVRWVLLVPARLLLWLFGDRATRALGRPVEVRVVTLIMAAAATVIVLSLVGLWIASPGRLRSDLVEGDFPYEPPGPASALVPAPEGAGGQMLAQGAGRVDRSIWSERDAAREPAPEIAGEHSARRTSRQLLPPDGKRYWIQMRALMEEGESRRLVNHLAGKVITFLESEHRPGGAETSMAYKDVVAVADGTTYSVIVGPFSTVADAREAIAEFQRLAKQPPFMFEGRESYFDRIYPVNESEEIARAVNAPGGARILRRNG